MHSVMSAKEIFKFRHHPEDIAPPSELNVTVCPTPQKKGSKQRPHRAQTLSMPLAFGAHPAISTKHPHNQLWSKTVFLGTCSTVLGGILVRAAWEGCL